MQKILAAAALTLMTCSCAHKTRSETAVQEQAISGRPVVSIVPLIDHSHSGLSWNLSDEMTSSICQRLASQDKLHLCSPESVKSVTKKLNDRHDPFGLDTSWIKKAFSGSEYVAFLEMIEHGERPLPSQDRKDASAEFAMSVRVRLFDLRGSEPKVVLQEIVSDIQRLPKQFTSAHFHQVAWGDDTYVISPLGIAHAGLAKEIAERIEDYILISYPK